MFGWVARDDKTFSAAGASRKCNEDTEFDANMCDEVFSWFTESILYP